jgi:hypothetical protein
MRRATEHQQARNAVTDDGAEAGVKLNWDEWSADALDTGAASEWDA